MAQIGQAWDAIDNITDDLKTLLSENILDVRSIGV